MFADVEPFELLTFTHADASTGRTEDGPEDGGGDDREDGEGQHTNQLDPKLPEAVHGEGSYWIVDAQEKEALVAIGITGITVTSVNGFGKQLGHTEVYRGVKVEARLLPKVMLTLLVSDEKARDVMNTLREATMTGEIGDGKIVVLAVEEAMRIRTGETGEASIS